MSRVTSQRQAAPLVDVRAEFLGNLVREPEDDGLGEAAPRSVRIEIAERILGKRPLVHPRPDDGRSNRFTALHPDPVDRPTEKGPRRLASMTDFLGEVHEAERAVRNTVEIDLRRELEYSHP
jgi:hypothetical protein